MALTVINDALNIMGVRDPMWYEVRCDGWRLTAAATASYTIVLVQNPDAGMTFVLTLGTTVLTFTFVSDPPNDSGLQVRVGADSTITTGYLLAALQANWYVDQQFVVTEAAGVITLTSREAGAREVGLANTTPVTMAFATVSAGADATYAEGYTANIEVWIEQVWASGTYTPVAAYDAQPDPATRLARWDISRLLRPPYLGWAWPAYGTTGITVADKVVRRYYVSRWEQHGDPPTPRVVQRSATKVAWLAGSRQVERNTIQTLWNTLTATSILNPLLTYRGRNGRHEVSPAQDHYIGWYRRIPKVTGQQVDLFATVTYSDGTTDTDVVVADANGSGLTEGRIALFPCGFERMGLDELQPTKVPVKYTVQVRTHLGAALSEAHTFWLVDADFNERHLEYVSSLGMIESLRCKGEWQVGMTVEHDEARRLLPVLNDVPRDTQESETVQLLRGAPKSTQLFTGWMQRGEFMAVLPDLLVSPAIKLLDAERSTRLPMRIANAELAIDKRGQEDEWMYGVNLELLSEDPEMAWSDRLHWPPDPGPELPGG